MIVAEDFTVRQNIFCCTSYKKKKKDIPKLFGVPIKFSTVTNPSNIKWENRNYTALEKVIRVILIQIALLFILMAAYFVIYVIKDEIALLQAKWPKISYCDVIEQTFVGQSD